MWIFIVAGALYLIGVGVVLVLRPSFMFTPDGAWKEFGIGKNDERYTPCPFWLFCLTWAAISYILVILTVPSFVDSNRENRISKAAREVSRAAADVASAEADAARATAAARAVNLSRVSAENAYNDSAFLNEIRRRPHYLDYYEPRPAPPPPPPPAVAISSPDSDNLIALRPPPPPEAQLPSPLRA